MIPCCWNSPPRRQKTRPPVLKGINDTPKLLSKNLWWHRNGASLIPHSCLFLPQTIPRENLASRGAALAPHWLLQRLLKQVCGSKQTNPCAQSVELEQHHWLQAGLVWQATSSAELGFYFLLCNTLKPWERSRRPPRLRIIGAFSYMPSSCCPLGEQGLLDGLGSQNVSLKQIWHHSVAFVLWNNISEMSYLPYSL